MSSEKRPNRAHGKVHSLPLEWRRKVDDWIVGNPDRLTYRQIAEELRDAGFEVSPSGIGRYAKTFAMTIERHRMNVERADVIMRRLDAEGNRDMEETTNLLLRSCLLEALVDATPQRVQSVEDLAKLSNAAGRLTSAVVARDRMEATRKKAVAETAAEFQRRLQDEIAGDRELLGRILAVVDGVVKEMDGGETGHGIVGAQHAGPTGIVGPA